MKIDRLFAASHRFRNALRAEPAPGFQLLRVILASTLLGLLVACASKPPVPPWRQTAVTQQNNYLQFALRGRSFPADLHYREALNAIRQSADIPSLATLYLTRAAVHRTLGTAPDLQEFFAIADLGAQPSQFAYARMLANPSGDFPLEDIPEIYRPFIKLMRSEAPSNEDFLKSLQKIDQPFPQVLAAALHRHRYGDSVEVLELTATTASAQGWTQLLRATWETLATLQAQQGQSSAAQRTRRLLELLPPPE